MKKYMSIERKHTRALYFKEEVGYNYEESTRNISKTFQQLNNIGSPICPAEEVSYLIDGIKASNDEIKMGEITARTNIIGMVIKFEAAVIHISNCRPEGQSTCIILSV